MSEYDIKAVQLSVRSSNAALPRQWTTILCSLTADGIRYSPIAHPEKAMLLIDLTGIESIGNYDTGKSEPAFQVKWKGTTTLHKCSDDTAVRNWVDKVMAAKLGPSNMESDSTDSYDDDDDDGSTEEYSSSGSEKVVLKKSSKSEEKSKAPKDKSKTSGKSAASKTPSKESSKSKTAEVKSKSKDKKSKDKKEKDKKTKSGKENGNSKKGNEDAGAGAGSVSGAGAAAGVETPSKAGKRTKSASTPAPSTSNNSYVPQWAAHYDGIRVQERQSAFQKMELEDLVKLISGGLERTAREARDKVLSEWATQKRAKLAELHELELQELEKKQQRELEDVSKRFKEFSEQPF